MTIDLTVALWCLFGPAGIAFLAVLPIRGFAERRSVAGGGARTSPEGSLAQSYPGSTAASVGAAVAWWLATTVAVTGRQGWQWWPEDAWRQPIWSILAFGIVLAATIGSGRESGGDRWVIAAVLGSLVAFFTMPSGDAWSDVLPLHRAWMTAVTVSCLVNAWSIDRISRSGASRWALWVVLAGLAGPMLLAAATYGALAEWMLAALAATFVLAIAASLNVSSAVASAYPALATSASVTASARFYSYEDHPWWVFALILFLPTLIAAIDRPLRSQSGWRRVIVAGCAAAALVAVIAWMVLLHQPEETW